MKRGKFSLSNTKLLTCDMGELIPAGWFEVLPGDTVQQATSALVRSMPLVAPVFHNVNVRMHHFFVPYRILWNSWEDFITAGPDGLNASVFPTIQFAAGQPLVGSLADYLGVPTVAGAAGFDASALPFRAYALIWNEFFRDQDLQTALTISLADGVDSTTSKALQNIAWEKDYFTSSRPWEQKGPSITIPIGTTAPVKTQSVEQVTGAQPGITMRFSAAGGGNFANGPLAGDGSTPAKGYVGSIGAGATTNYWYPSNLAADLTNASAVTINALRQAMALQRYEEARARYGSRYTEYLRYLGVRSSDARLQRPEYLGGGVQTIQYSEVLATAASTSPATNVGDLKGHGLAAMRSNRYRKFFEEHGLVMTLLSVRPKTMYSQGLMRKFNRRAKEDFWQMELQHIGQQKVLNKEIYANHTTPAGTFGYQDRYDEYRREESTIAGLFRSTFNFWHFARNFSSDPALNGTFVSAVPTKLPFADQANDDTLVYVRNNIQARRLVAQVGTSFIF